MLKSQNNMNIQETIGSIVADDYRTAVVFSKFNIDFCCKGGRSIAEACAEKGINPSLVVEAIMEIRNAAPFPGESDMQRWSATELAEYVEKTHHRYVRETQPILSAYLKKLAAVHGDRHSELREIYALFQESTVELLNHMIKEETILFPAIKRMESMINNGKLMEKPFFFGTVENPIAMMRHEHVAEGERFAHIATLSHNYTPPEDACNTYKVAFAKLKEFEADLHRHIHLENNILFHKAIALEQKLSVEPEPEYTSCSCSVANH
jgi:regulator of cell morphogenesis and NO signaling